MLGKKARGLIEHLQPSAYMDYRNFLGDVYQALKAEFKPYSYITFTEEMGLGNCNAMLLVISRRRPLTVKNARKVATSLGLKFAEREYFIKLVEYQGTKGPGDREKVFGKLLAIKSSCLASGVSQESLDFFSEWYHSAIYELLKFDNAKDDPKWICSKLKPRIPESKASESLELLQRLKMISLDEMTGRLTPLSTRISTGPEIRGMVFTSYHHRMLDLASRSISEQSGSQRDISAVTISVARDKMQKIKAATADFRKTLLEISEDDHDDKEQVLQVNIQIFPLAEVEKK